MKNIAPLYAVLAFLPLAVHGAPGVRNIAPGDSLMAAVAELGAEGGTVYLADGDYVFTSDTDTAVTITTPVKVVGLSRDASKVTITRTGTPTRNFVLNHPDCSLEYVTVVGGTLRSDKGVSISLRNGLLSDCVIRDADGRDWQCHGALYADGDSRVMRCVFRGNKGQYDGSALQARGNVVIENCLFTDNDSVGGAEHGGGTVNLGDNVRLINCTVTGNRGLRSTGIYVHGNGVSVLNCAIYGNTADSDTSSTQHGHVWWNNPDAFSYCASDPSGSGEPINATCYLIEPGFRSAVDGDYTLTPASALIDQGCPYDITEALSTTDLAGNPRCRKGGTAELGGPVDIGCYEYAARGADLGVAASVSSGLSPLPVTFSATVFGAESVLSYAWDFDNDGYVDETTSVPSVTHTYAQGGVKSVCVTVATSRETLRATLRDAVLVIPKYVYVNSANAANAQYPYDTPTTATAAFEEAVAAAGTGSEVLLADGAYPAPTADGYVVDKAITVRSLSGNPAACVLAEGTHSGERRVMTLNHPRAVLANLTLEGGESAAHKGHGASLLLGDLGGTVSNCIIRAGKSRDWGGDGALVCMNAGRITHSILEEGVALDDYSVKNEREVTASVAIRGGQVDNCLVRGFNRSAGNQNIVTVRAGGKLLNCTIVDGLCGNAMPDGSGEACFAVRALSGSRVENCAIVGVRHQEDDGTYVSRAWGGDAACFFACATDTAEKINASCFTVTTRAFRDFANRDYRPASGSKLLNNGATNELADGTDLEGNRRKFGAQDIGCYEFDRAGFALILR